ncbi:MAG: metal-dependent hydrolase, partial [Nitrospinota bacterium]
TEGGARVFVDPYLTGNPLCPIAAAEVTSADLILVTHGAWDHLGDAVELAKRTGAILLSGHDVRAHAGRKGVPKEQLLGTQPGATREVRGVRVRATEARHTSFFESEENLFLSAPPLGYVIYTQEGHRIYHAGDTCLFLDMKLIAELCRPQVMMVPVDSVRPDTPAEMSPLDAATATRWVGPDVVVPMHYYPGSQSPEAFAKHAETLAPGTQVLLRPEGYFTYEPPRARFL